MAWIGQIYAEKIGEHPFHQCYPCFILSTDIQAIKAL
jgi:hypothetical protein